MAKKARKRVEKEKRTSLRLWAEGARETILDPHLAPYTDALERGWRAEREYLRAICNEFHARIPWRLGDHEEPELPLPAYDPKKPQPPETLDDEEAKRKRARIKVLDEVSVNSAGGKLDPRKDPWAILLAKLSGLNNPPKARQAYQQFMREAYDSDIAPLVAERWAAESSDGSNVQTKKSPDAAFRSKIAREVFGSLTDAEREAYGARAKEEARAARATYDAGLNNPPSKAPEEKQKCIDAVGNFLAPILQGILERTGLHSVVLMGGPIPTEEECAEAALPDVLTQAKYTMDDPRSDEDNDSEVSDSESDSSSDSNADSDDDAPAKRKRRERSEMTKSSKAGKAKTTAKKPSAKRTPKKTSKAAAPAESAADDDEQPDDDSDVDEDAPFAGLPIAEVIQRTLTGKAVRKT
ncbi:hypothetical protein DFH06DRAFT_1146985, partial [Mycena polygramma]